MLAFFVNKAICCKTITFLGIKLLVGSLVLLPIAIGEEFSQVLIPSRRFSVLDLTANVLGIVIIGQLAMFKRSKVHV
jgi:glycopeptide antibiotics resistance protein